MSARSKRDRSARGVGGASSARRRRWPRWLFGLLVIPAVALGAAGLLGFYLVFSSVPLPDDLTTTSSVVYDRDGEELGGLLGEVAREDVALSSLPQHVPAAVLGAEDRGFFDHRGISARGVLRALFTNVRAGSVQQGGSTITQQYIKNATLTAEQTYTRKVEEAALAIKMEQEFAKDEILENYLNTIYWGRGTYGIEAAARTYYGVPAEELDANQAATLAGIIAAPEAFDPLDAPERADQRRRFALGGMLEIGALTSEEHDELVASGLPETSERALIDQGPNAYYLDAVRRELGGNPAFAQGELFRGLHIHTELDPSMQLAAQEELTDAIAEGPTDTGAIVSIDPASGGVRALAGGPDIDAQQFNTAVRATRQPGSTFKPFTLQAFIEAGWSPESTFAAPAEIEVDDDASVRNFGGSSFGEQTVRQATASSTNTVYVQMQEEVGREAVIGAARAAGLPGDASDEVFRTDRSGAVLTPVATLTLGVASVTPLEMTSAMGTYAAEGRHVQPRLVTRVEDTDGRILFEPGPRDRETVDTEVARTVTDVLRDVVTSGSGTAAALDDRPVAGKTGTTQEGRDVWFTGYVPQLATSVWLGNLDNSPIEADNATGGGMAAPVWREYMTRAVDGLDVIDFTAPSLELELLDGDVAEECPEGYEFADPPTEADEDGFFPDILTDITDDDGRPCVEIKPELEQCPAGYEFADPPSEPDEHGRMPDVLDEPRDFQGRPCVEVLEEPEPEDEPDEEPDEDDEDDPDDDPDEDDADDEDDEEDDGQ